MIGKDLPTRFAWHPSRGRQHRSDVLHLAPWAERRVDVTVAEQQVVLVLRDHGVQTVLEPGVRPLSVGTLDGGWARKGGSQPVADREREQCLAVSSADLLLYIPMGALPELQWTLSREDLRGSAQVHVTDPQRYYESFLRNSEDLEEEALMDTIGMMLRGVIVRWLEQRGGGYESGSPALAEELRIAASAALASVGLELMSFHTESIREHQHA